MTSAKILSDIAMHNSKRTAHYDAMSAAEHTKLVLDAGRLVSWSWELNEGQVYGDRDFAALFEIDYDEQPWPIDSVFTSMHPDDVDRVQASVDEALNGKNIYDTEFRLQFFDPDTGDERCRWLGARGNVTERDADGAPLRLIGVNWDATRQKEHEKRLEMLAAEMDHRVKNAFAVIRALVNMGMRTDDDKATFAHTLKGQIDAIATAHNVSASMARDTEQPSAPIAVEQVISAALSPWIEERLDLRTTVQINADRAYLIAPGKVNRLSMLIYELMTDSTKYGALGERGGRLTVDLSQDEAGALCIIWAEVYAAPSTDARPTEDDSDFGTVLLAHCMTMLTGTMTKDVSDDGTTMTIRFPLDGD